jgi:hypothetical protein
VRENRTHGSEGGEGEGSSLPLSVDSKLPREAEQHGCIVRCAECLLLDSRLRGNDEANELF